MASINAIIDDRIIDHMVDLERLKAGQRRKVLALLQKLEGDLVSALLTHDPNIPTRTAFQQRRVEALLKQTRETIRSAYQEIIRTHQVDLTALARVEATATVQVLNGAAGEILRQAAQTQAGTVLIELASVRLSVEQLSEIASNTLIQGAATREWWARESIITQRRFADTVRAGMLRGETTQQISREVRQQMGIARRAAEGLVRSSVQAVATSVQEKTWDANADLLQALVWTSTLDLRTSEWCITRDGKRYTTPDHKPIGHAIPWREGPGRIHPLCRSAPRPEIKDADDLFDENVISTGGRPTTPRALFEKKLRELRPDLTDEQISRVIQNARASIDGEVVATTNFEKFLRRRSVADQNAALGVGKAKLWREGKITFADLVDFRGRPVTLAEIQAKLGIENV